METKPNPPRWAVVIYPDDGGQIIDSNHMSYALAREREQAIQQQNVPFNINIEIMRRLADGSLSDDY